MSKIIYKKTKKGKIISLIPLICCLIVFIIASSVHAGKKPFSELDEEQKNVTKLFQQPSALQNQEVTICIKIKSGKKLKINISNFEEREVSLITPSYSEIVNSNQNKSTSSLLIPSINEKEGFVSQKFTNPFSFVEKDESEDTHLLDKTNILSSFQEDSSNFIYEDPVISEQTTGEFFNPPTLLLNPIGNEELQKESFAFQNLNDTTTYVVPSTINSSQQLNVTFQTLQKSKSSQTIRTRYKDEEKEIIRSIAKDILQKNAKAEYIDIERLKLLVRKEILNKKELSNKLGNRVPDPRRIKKFILEDNTIIDLTRVPVGGHPNWNFSDR